MLPLTGYKDEGLKKNNENEESRGTAQSEFLVSVASFKRMH